MAQAGTFFFKTTQTQGVCEFMTSFNNAIDAPASVGPVLKLLEKLEVGTLHLTVPNGQIIHFGNDDALTAHLHLKDWRMLTETMKSGDVGLALAYIDGHWDSPNLTLLLQLFIANRDALERVVYGSWWGSFIYRIKHLLNRNTKAGSSRNILSHYDLGNNFYKLWLSPDMNYSSAWFKESATTSLQDAQWAKVRRALDESGIGPGERILEIGFGWGAVAEVAARECKASLTGVTLSNAQYDYARKRLADQRLVADLRIQDYRDLNAEFKSQPFDAIVSIEMFEAVGREYWDSYFNTLKTCLKPSGKAVIQSIVIRDDLFERYAAGTDFIQQCIFPGGCLPSVAEFNKAAHKRGLKVTQTHELGRDYAKTLALWRQSFLSRSTEVMALGFDDKFMRLWNFYLVYCEAAFVTGNTNVYQFTLEHSN